MEIICFLVIIGIFLNTQINNGAGDLVEKKLLKHILSKASTLERPVADHNLPLNVYIKFTLQQIIDVDEKNQVITTNAWLDLKWNNYLWKWKRGNYGNMNKTRIPFENIWKPDILLYNSADSKFDATTHTPIVVDHEGNCSYIPPGIFKSTCKIDVSYFPFDEQRCTLKFGVWSYNGNQVDLQLQASGGADVTEYMESGEWKLIDVIATRNSHKYECCSEKFVDVTFTLVIRRRTMFYVMNLILPCILNSVLTLITFFLPAAAGEKITLAITVLLAQIVFMLLVMEAMPPTSDAIPLISKYFACSLITVCSSVGGTVLVLSFYYTSPDIDGRMPPALRKFLLVTAPSWMRIKPYAPVTFKSEIRSKNISNSKIISRQNIRQNSPATMTSRLSASQKCVVGVALNSTISSEQQPSTKRMIELDHPAIDVLNSTANARQKGGKLDSQSVSSATSNQPTEEGIKDRYFAMDSRCTTDSTKEWESSVKRSCMTCGILKKSSGLLTDDMLELRQILKELGKLNTKMELESLNEQILQEWQFASRVLDKMLLYFFSLFVVIATLATLFAVPNITDAFNM